VKGYIEQYSEVTKLLLREKRGLVVLAGGPYLEYADAARHAGDRLVCMAEELEGQRPVDVWVPTRDFSTPDVRALDRGVRTVVFRSLAFGTRHFVGCRGGIGRTGLFMACVAKAVGVREPVAVVREQYDERAVETARQAKFVADYKPGAWRHLIPLWAAVGKLSR